MIMPWSWCFVPLLCSIATVQGSLYLGKMGYPETYKCSAGQQIGATRISDEYSKKYNDIETCTQLPTSTWRANPLPQPGQHHAPYQLLQGQSLQSHNSLSPITVSHMLHLFCANRPYAEIKTIQWCGTTHYCNGNLWNLPMTGVWAMLPRDMKKLSVT